MRSAEPAGGAGALLAATSGLIVWSSAFVLLYAGLSVGCRTPLPDMRLLGVNSLSAALVAVWGVHLAALALLQRRHVRRARRNAEGPARFLAVLSCMITAAGLLATVLVGAALVLLPPCA